MRAEIFGKYQMLTRIASGGMAEVWLARSSSIGGFEKLLAIKRMHPNLSANQAFISMFIVEAKLTVQLNHPNIVQIFDFGQVDEDYFMAMEYVEGVDLAAIAKRARKKGVGLPVDTCAYLLRGVMDGLTYAHTRKLSKGGEVSGVIHRDISPQNILVSFDGHVKVSDFGIAQAVSEIHNTTKGEVFGKLAYVSPEQCRGETVDEATDIWAAGVVLHELLANQRLFARGNDYQTIEAVEKGEVPSPRSLNPNVPEELDRLVLRMLERDPSKRMRSAREASEALAVIIGKNYPTATQFRLTEVLETLWDGSLPRIVSATGEVTHTEITRGHRPPEESTKPVGENTANEIAVVAARREKQVRQESSWNRETSSQAIAVAEVVKELAAERQSSSTTALNPLEVTYSGNKRGPTQEIARLKRLFIASPSLWLLVDIGETYELAGERRRALAAWKLAAAKFAQRGLLIQAATIYRAILDKEELDERLRDELKRLPALQGMPDKDLLLEIFDPDDETADYSEYQDVFDASADPVDVYAESPILSSLSAEQFATVVLALKLGRYRPNQVILREGDSGDSFFMLGRGRVVVSATNFEGLKIYMTSLSDGDSFGEHGFFTGEPRSASVEAVEDVWLLEIEKEVLNRVIQEFPTVRESLRRFYKERIAESLLAKSHLFGHLSTRARKGLAERFTFETYAAGDLVIREGDVSDAFYAIKSGSVQVYAGLDDAPVRLAKLGAGEIFGEIAAIEGTRRTASVRTLEDCELLRLEASELNAMLAKNMEIRRMIELKIEERSEAKLQKMIDQAE